MEAPGIEVLKEGDEDITRVRVLFGGKEEKQTRVKCRMCSKEFWCRTWLLLNMRPGSCKDCALIRSKRWGFGNY